MFVYEQLFYVEEQFVERLYFTYTNMQVFVYKQKCVCIQNIGYDCIQTSIVRIQTKNSLYTNIVRVCIRTIEIVRIQALIHVYAQS